MNYGVSTGFTYIYNYTDHLGNIRLSYTKGAGSSPPVIVEESHYYPFGLKHKKYGQADPIPALAYQYKYNGKEYQDELNLNVYDYGARMYMPDIARWGQIDPKAEQMRRHSPYNYAFNNPVYFIDPDGMAPDDWWKNKKGEYVWFNDAPAPTVTIRGNNYEYVGTSMADVSQDFSERWNSFSRMFLSPKFSTTEGDPYPGEMSQMSKSKEVGMKFEQWRGEGGTLAHLGVELTYGTADNIHIFATGAFGQARGISGQMYFGDHATNRALDGFTTLASLGFSKTT